MADFDKYCQITEVIATQTVADTSLDVDEDELPKPYLISKKTVLMPVIKKVQIKTYPVNANNAQVLGSIRDGILDIPIIEWENITRSAANGVYCIHSTSPLFDLGEGFPLLKHPVFRVQSSGTGVTNTARFIIYWKWEEVSLKEFLEGSGSL
jgi:hypothetical protein